MSNNQCRNIKDTNEELTVHRRLGKCQMKNVEWLSFFLAHKAARISVWVWHPCFGSTTLPKLSGSRFAKQRLLTWGLKKLFKWKKIWSTFFWNDFLSLILIFCWIFCLITNLIKSLFDSDLILFCLNMFLSNGSISALFSLKFCLTLFCVT